MSLIKCIYHHNWAKISTLALILTLNCVTKVSCQDQNILPLPSSSSIAGQLCISECGTCPVICSSSPPSPPSPPPSTTTPILPLSPLAAPQLLPPPPHLHPPSETIQPFLPPLLPLLPPPPEPKVSHTPPPPPPPTPPPTPSSPSSGPHKGGYNHPPPSSPAEFPLVINPAGPSPPVPYYYFYESSAAFSILPLPAYLSVIVVFAFL